MVAAGRRKPTPIELGILRLLATGHSFEAVSKSLGLYPDFAKVEFRDPPPVHKPATIRKLRVTLHLTEEECALALAQAIEQERQARAKAARSRDPEYMQASGRRLHAAWRMKRRARENLGKGSAVIHDVVTGRIEDAIRGLEARGEKVNASSIAWYAPCSRHTAARYLKKA
jgi:hypothetical protein